MNKVIEDKINKIKQMANDTTSLGCKSSSVKDWLAKSIKTKEDGLIFMAQLNAIIKSIQEK